MDKTTNICDYTVNGFKGSPYRLEFTMLVFAMHDNAGKVIDYAESDKREDYLEFWKRVTNDSILNRPSNAASAYIEDLDTGEVVKDWRF